MQTPKKFSSFSDQVSWISDEKGIKIKDREYAEEMLRQIGYFPLMGGYKHLFRISNTKKYKAGTSFEEIVSLYKFDAELRELFFKYLLQIERQMRSLMSYYFTEMYGAEQKQYLDANNYNNTKRNHATIVKLIATLKRATTTTDYTYINYSEDCLLILRRMSDRNHGRRNVSFVSQMLWASFTWYWAMEFILIL